MELSSRTFSRGFPVSRASKPDLCSRTLHVLWNLRECASFSIKARLRPCADTFRIIRSARRPSFDGGMLTNGELLDQAESAGFEVLITTDQSLRYQQNLSARRIAIVVICTTSWLRIEKCIGVVTEAVRRASSGRYEEVRIP